MKEGKHRIMLVQLLFEDEFITMVERMDVHLSIWKQKGRCVDLLEKSHSVVNVTIFMSAVKYMQCICRARVIVFNVHIRYILYSKRNFRTLSNQ